MGKVKKREQFTECYSSTTVKCTAVDQLSVFIDQISSCMAV